VNAERWQKLGFTLFTKEYCAGIIGGAGLGILTIISIPPEHLMPKYLLRLIAFFCISAGSIWARAAQQKRLQNDKAKKENAISN
jgi:hypothetical protein